MTTYQVYWGACAICRCPTLGSDGPLVLVDNQYVCRRHVQLARRIRYTQPPPEVQYHYPGGEWNDRDTVEGSDAVIETPPGYDAGSEKRGVSS